MKSRGLYSFNITFLVFAGLTVLASTCIWHGCDLEFQSDERQFAHAVQMGNREGAERLLARNPKLLQMKDQYGRTPLYLAVSAIHNSADMVAWLLTLGIDVNETEQNGFSPLFWAAFKGDTRVVELLIENGADVDSKSHDGRTPLYVAAEKEFSDIAFLLIRHGANVNVASKEGLA